MTWQQRVALLCAPALMLAVFFGLPRLLSVVLQ